MEREIARTRCTTEDHSTVMVIEYQHVAAPVPGAPARDYPGARRLALASGEAVRYIDARTFEVIGSGELLHRLD
ncbi:hypothetical protein [Sphingomonas alpina]|uniref:Uncharacterized protein n=1 Tax=Sphingomonas alpina TaxID=653931 RepID=A0A7H0LJ30_9SPHN|nr:hypothetical protein [Sphingomonas alpina]QNQ09683.1 hypothetical protein H3Z74_24200 [Sphingomonas alpina]